MNQNLTSYLINFVIYFVLQVVFLHHVSLFNVAFCFVYVSILLFMPFNIGTIPFMLMGFGLGLLVDFSYGTTGIHAAACVLMCYARPYVISNIEPISGYDGNSRPLLRVMGLAWFSRYALIMIGIHHILLFIIEVGNFSFFFSTLLKIIFSVGFTYLVILLFQYIFHSSKVPR